MWRYFLYVNMVAFLIFASLRVHLEFKQVSGFPATSWREDVEAECAVVLTGGPGRVREGYDLLYRGAVKRLIISGVNPKVGLREIFPNGPLQSGVRDEDIILERRSTTTYGNAQQSLPLVEALHCRSLALVTSTLHMYRAQKTFHSVFPPDFPIHAHAIVGGALHPPFWDVFEETVKSVFYSLWVY